MFQSTVWNISVKLKLHWRNDEDSWLSLESITTSNFQQNLCKDAERNTSDYEAVIYENVKFIDATIVT